MDFKAASTGFYANLNISEEAAAKAAAIKQTTQAYGDYLVKKATLNSRVLEANAQLDVVKAELVGSKTLASIDAGAYNNPNAYIDDVLDTALLEDSNNSRKSIAEANVAKVITKLTLLTDWGKAVGFEESETE